MSAIFNFNSLITIFLLAICTCAYIRARHPSWIDYYKIGSRGVPYKLARIGERLSPLISLALVAIAVNILMGNS